MAGPRSSGRSAGNHELCSGLAGILAPRIIGCSWWHIRVGRTKRSSSLLAGDPHLGCRSPDRVANQCQFSLWKQLWEQRCAFPITACSAPYGPGMPMGVVVGASDPQTTRHFLLSFCVAFSYDEERAVARKGSRVGEISGRRRKRRISTWRPDRMNGVNASLKSNRSPRFLNRAVR